MNLDPEFLEILACPSCKGPLEPADGEDALDCRACRLRFPVEDGIPVLLLDRAQRDA